MNLHNTPAWTFGGFDNLVLPDFFVRELKGATSYYPEPIQKSLVVDVRRAIYAARKKLAKLKTQGDF